jgi:prepilin-type N-terminal cleavage/methylation domain-containing protein
VTARHPAERGFTLIEVAIALGILGIGVVTALELFSGALRMVQSSAVRTRAVVHARAIFDQTLAIPEIQPGMTQGDFGDGFRWERIVRAAPEYTDVSGRDLDVSSTWTVYEIEVSVVWDQTTEREGVFALRTLRVVPEPGL